jgi:cytoskeleton protein RodZ
VGALLRDARLRRGEDVAKVAANLRIRQPYLQALEDGQVQNLPGSTYAVGFVRAYADYLRLDPDEIVRRFKQENGEIAAPQELAFPSAASESGIPTIALLGMALVAAGIAYGAWYWYQSRDTSITEAVPALPDRLAALIKRPVGDGSEVVPVRPADRQKTAEASGAAIQPPQAPPGSPHEDVIPPSDDNNNSGNPGATGEATQPTASAPAAPGPMTPPVETPPAPPDAAGAAKDGRTKAAKAAKLASDANPPPALPAPAAPAEAEPSAEAPATPEASALTDAGSRIVLRADEDCWIQIRDAAGQVVTTRLLHKGDSLPVPPGSGLKLTAGNAGALTLLVDGKPTRALGRLGMVRRDVPLDADRLTPRPPSE